MKIDKSENEFWEEMTMKLFENAKQREKVTEWIYAIGGSVIYAIGFNMLIVPMGLYSGGFMGLCQLLNLAITKVFGIAVPDRKSVV